MISLKRRSIYFWRYKIKVQWSSCWSSKIKVFGDWLSVLKTWVVSRFTNKLGWLQWLDFIDSLLLDIWFLNAVFNADICIRKHRSSASSSCYLSFFQLLNFFLQTFYLRVLNIDLSFVLHDQILISLVSFLLNRNLLSD